MTPASAGGMTAPRVGSSALLGGLCIGSELSIWREAARSRESQSPSRFEIQNRDGRRHRAADFRDEKVLKVVDYIFLIEPSPRD